jgi:exonuclease SbcC
VKPHLLTLEAFGPYVGPVEIGFDELALDGLFLIHGSTGAGKTFLLDGMSFALYGQVAGARGNHTLKSSHADPRATPRVSLEFSAQGDRYRVERTPAHSMPKLRGEGDTPKAATASLVRLDGATQVTIATSITEVRSEVERLVGLDSSQFQQVILLPQGRFEQVLRADSGEREKLLKTLFDTELYERATYWLEDKAKAARAEVFEQQRSLDVMCDEAARRWRPFAPDPDDVDTDVELPPADQAALDGLVVAIGEVVADAKETVDQAKAQKDLAQVAKEQTDAVAARWDRRTHALSRLDELTQQHDVINADRDALASAERAESLRGSLDAEQTHREAVAELDLAIAERLAAVGTARDAGINLPDAVRELDLDTLPSASARTAAQTSLATYRAELDELQNKAIEADAEAEKAEAALTLETTLRVTAEQGAADVVTRTTDRATAAALLTQAHTARDQLPGLTQVADAARIRAEAAQALVAARTEQDKADRAEAKAERAAISAHKAANDLRKRYLDGIAATLAGSLVDTEACPVCGSREHPAPAVAAPDAVAKGEVDDAEAAAEGADRDAKLTTEALAKVNEQVATLQVAAGDAGDDPAAAKSDAKSARAALDLATQMASTVEQSEKAVTDLDGELAKLNESVNTTLAQADTATKTASMHTERVQVLRSEVARALGEGIAPQDALEALGPLMSALTTLAQEGEKVASAAAQLRAASERLDRELAASSFPDQAAARAALRDDATRSDLAGRIRAYDDDLVKQQGILEAPDLADLPDERPDTQAVEQAVTLADEAHTLAVEHHKGARDAQTELTRLAGAYRAGEKALGDRREYATAANSVADRCAGKLAPKISLQRWVLAAYLTDICRHANSRLDKMTSGRYQMLVHSDSERGGKQAGLGIRVRDAFTGEEREVSSLSGGETFQASLALALGVADAVQAHSGGVHLDALFIDEGFGTLDPDNLQLAMDELDRLREGGRMVGIISHVGALRERIRTGIEVISTDHGSTVRVGASPMV